MHLIENSKIDKSSTECQAFLHSKHFRYQLEQLHQSFEK